MDYRRGSNSPVAARLFRAGRYSSHPALRALGSHPDRDRRHPDHIGSTRGDISLSHFDDQTGSAKEDNCSV